MGADADVDDVATTGAEASVSGATAIVGEASPAFGCGLAARVHESNGMRARTGTTALRTRERVLKPRLQIARSMRAGRRIGRRMMPSTRSNAALTVLPRTRNGSAMSHATG